MKKFFDIVVKVFQLKKERISVIDFFQIEQPPKSLPPVSITCLKHEGMIPKDLLERGYTFTDLRNHYSLPEIIDSLGKNAIKALINEGCSFQDFINEGVNSWHVIDYFSPEDLKSQKDTLMIVLRDFYAENRVMNILAFEKLLIKGYDLLSLDEELNEGTSHVYSCSGLLSGIYVGTTCPENGLDLFRRVETILSQKHISRHILSFCSYIKNFSLDEVKNVCEKGLGYKYPGHTEWEFEYYFKFDKVNNTVNAIVNDGMFKHFMRVLRYAETQNLNTKEIKEPLSLESLITAGIPPKSFLKKEDITTGADHSLVSEIYWERGIERRISRLSNAKLWSRSSIYAAGIRYTRILTDEKKRDIVYHQLCNDGYPAKLLLKNGFAKGVYFYYAKKNTKLALDLGMNYSDFCIALSYIKPYDGFEPNPIIYRLFRELNATEPAYPVKASCSNMEALRYFQDNYCHEKLGEWVSKQDFMKSSYEFRPRGARAYEVITKEACCYLPDLIPSEYGEEKLKQRGFPDNDVNYFFSFARALDKEKKALANLSEEKIIKIFTDEVLVPEIKSIANRFNQEEAKRERETFLKDLAEIELSNRRSIENMLDVISGPGLGW